MRERVAQRLKALRQLKNLSQEEVANQLNMSSSAYARMENGNSQSWAIHLDKLAKLFEVSPEYFVKEEGNTQYNNIKNGGFAFQNNGKVKNMNYLSEKLIEQYESRIAFLENLVNEKLK